MCAEPRSIAVQRLGGFLGLTNLQSDEHLPFGEIVRTFGSLAPPNFSLEARCFPALRASSFPSPPQRENVAANQQVWISLVETGRGLEKIAEDPKLG
jgi:hypothetical protein